MNKKHVPAEYTSNTYRENSKANNSTIKVPNSTVFLFKRDMDCDYFPWRATFEIMEIIRRRRKIPETLRLVERRLEISRPGTMRRNVDLNAQRQIWVPSRPNKRSREEMAEKYGELLNRANRFGGGYRPLEERVEENPPQEEIVENELESEGESQIVRADTFTIVDLKTYNTDRKEVQFIQINQVLNESTGDKKVTEETTKKTDLNFMLDIKTLIAKSAADAELYRVRDAMRRGEKTRTAPEQCRRIFEKLSNKWGLTFNDDMIIVLTELNKKVMETLHFGHARSTKMLAETRIF